MFGVSLWSRAFGVGTLHLALNATVIRSSDPARGRFFLVVSGPPFREAVGVGIKLCLTVSPNLFDFSRSESTPVTAFPILEAVGVGTSWLFR
jgi:hypothetical protein